MKEKNRWIPLAALLIVLTLYPFVIQVSYYQHLVIWFFIWVVIGSAWNIMAGFAGMVSFGDAVFFGVGSYTGGILFTKLHISPWWGMAFGGFSGMIMALFMGFITFRLRGPYFVLATLAVAEIMRFIVANWVDFTEGMVGILIIPTWTNKIPYYFIMFAITIACIWVIDRVIRRSKWGYYFIAIREDQDAAESLGINTFKYRLIAFSINGFFTGLAGAFYTVYMGFIDPHIVFSLHYISIWAVLVAIIGGVGTVWGPVVGALVMVGMEEAFRTSLFGLLPAYFSRAHALSFGILVIIVIRYLPAGIVGDWRRITNLFVRSKS